MILENAQYVAARHKVSLPGANREVAHVGIERIVDLVECVNDGGMIEQVVQHPGIS